jgi:hypothetical protein
MRCVFLVLVLMVASVSSPARPATATSRIASFFEGRTESRGELRRLFSKTHVIVTRGVGRIEPDNTLVLEQTVEETDTAPTKRVWRLREDRPGHCTGTVSDGVGPVDGELTANQLHLTFALNGGLSVEQWLSLQPDGQSASNLLKIHKYGIHVATLEDTIRKVE